MDTLIPVAVVVLVAGVVLWAARVPRVGHVEAGTPTIIMDPVIVGPTDGVSGGNGGQQIVVGA